MIWLQLHPATQPYIQTRAAEPPSGPNVISVTRSPTRSNERDCLWGDFNNSHSLFISYKSHPLCMTHKNTYTHNFDKDRLYWNGRSYQNHAGKYLPTLLSQNKCEIHMYFKFNCWLKQSYSNLLYLLFVNGSNMHTMFSDWKYAKPPTVFINIYLQTRFVLDTNGIMQTAITYSVR